MANVQLIAQTYFDASKSLKLTGFAGDEDNSISGSEALIEFAGRACYQSWNKPNPATANNAGYLANIIKQKHFSVLEHSQATFYITEIPRSLTHEFIRHRHFSYSELSQRYVNVESYDTICPPDLASMKQSPLWADTEDTFDKLDNLYVSWTETLEARGYLRKEARQAARFVLPESKETRIVVTGNFRTWIEFLEKRANPAADKAIQEVAYQIAEVLSDEFPNVFASYGWNEQNG